MDPIIYEQNRSRMVKTGMAFGIASLVCAITMFSVPYLAIGFGAFGIMFSLLARGSNRKLDKDGKVGVTTGIIGLGICIVIFASVFHALSTNDVYRKNVAGLMETLYGQTFEDDYGISVEDALDELLGK